MKPAPDDVGLFGPVPPPAPRLRGRPGWERLDAVDPRLGKGWGRWRFEPNDWLVRHCGHPTALFPYYIQTTEGQMIVAPNGRGFTHLALAQAEVERLFNEALGEEEGLRRIKQAVRKRLDQLAAERSASGSAGSNATPSALTQKVNATSTRSPNKSTTRVHLEH
jgi:hypothetical protein